ncbi:MAG: D-alanyl-D-alanine dipeptidase [Rhodospirillales bacterium]|nr:D-alanyl-D-alanine dipeptidase [Rhodospirillales bacterium]
MDLVEITPSSHGVQLDIVYATARNVTGKPVYARPAAWLHKDAAEKLARAAELARRLGLELRIFDAFRPTEAQWVFWNHVPDPEFFADPRKGSPHSRGVAVDLTLVRDGEPLDMGTEFDALTPLSHHGAGGIPAAAQANRYTLLGIMSAAGWDFYMNEWWHYQLFQPRRYPLLSDSVLPRSMMR